MRKRYKFLITLAVTLFLLWFGLGAAAGYTFTHFPHGRDFEDVGEIAGTPVDAITFVTRDGVEISAWHVKNNPDRVVLFAHGIGGTRRQGLRTAEMYQNWGYSLIMLDARSHGKSQPHLCTIGWNERFDLIAAYDYARDLGYETIAAHGTSLGAATISYSLNEEVDYAFMVLESCYDTADNALRNRVAMVGVPYVVTWPFRCACELFTGISITTLRPLNYLPKATAPTLFLAGDSEPEIKVFETQALFDACGSEVKALHLFEGGRHELFAHRFSEEYREVLGEFVAARTPATEAAQSAK